MLDRLQNFQRWVWGGVTHPVTMAAAIAIVAHGLVLAIPVPERKGSGVKLTPIAATNITSSVGAEPTPEPTPQAQEAKSKTQVKTKPKANPKTKKTTPKSKAKPRPKSRNTRRRPRRKSAPRSGAISRKGRAVNPQPKPKVQPPITRPKPKASVPPPPPLPPLAPIASFRPFPSPSPAIFASGLPETNPTPAPNNDPIANGGITSTTTNGNTISDEAIAELNEQFLARVLKSAEDKEASESFIATIPKDLMSESQLSFFVTGEGKDSQLLEGAIASLAVRKMPVAKTYYELVNPVLAESLEYSLQPLEPGYGAANLYLAEGKGDNPSFYFSMVQLRQGSGTFVVFWKDDPRASQG